MSFFKQNDLAGHYQNRKAHYFGQPLEPIEGASGPRDPRRSKVMGGGENCRSSTVEIWDAQGQWRAGPEMRPGCDAIGRDMQRDMQRGCFSAAFAAELSRLSEGVGKFDRVSLILSR